MKNKLKNYYSYIVDKVLNTPNKRRNAMIGITLSIVLFLISNIFLSNAFFFVSDSIKMITAVVGDYTLDDYDYVLNIYLEDINLSGEKKYLLTDAIPDNGYVYNSYTCKNNSQLEYNSDKNNIVTTLTEKDVCKVYFNKEE